jgi:phage terminase Nu1 subunit (DNA packaging protein)
LPAYNDSRARSEYEKANLLELQRKTQEGLLLRREDVELAWGGAVNITRTRLLGVPSTAKQRIPHLEIEEVELLTTLIREALDELAAGEVKA